MPNQGSKSTGRGTDRPPATGRPLLPFPQSARRNVFKRMVVSQLEAGFLRYSHRQTLLKQADRLGIPEFEASLLIAEAQFNVDDIEPIHFGSAATLETLTRPDAWSVPLRVSVALAAAVFIDLIVIAWLFA